MGLVVGGSGGVCWRWGVVISEVCVGRGDGGWWGRGVSEVGRGGGTGSRGRNQQCYEKKSMT